MRSEEWAKEVARLVKGYVEPLQKRIAELEEREQRSLADSFKGGLGTYYKRGDLTQASGSLWICLRATMDKPGEGADWRMLVRGAK